MKFIKTLLTKTGVFLGLLIVVLMIGWNVANAAVAVVAAHPVVVARPAPVVARPAPVVARPATAPVKGVNNVPTLPSTSRSPVTEAPKPTVAPVTSHAWFHWWGSKKCPSKDKDKECDK